MLTGKDIIDAGYRPGRWFAAALAEANAAQAEIERLRTEIEAARAGLAEDRADIDRRQARIAAEAKARTAAESVTRSAQIADLNRLRAAFDRMVCDLAVPAHPDPLVAAAALPEENNMPG